MKLKAEESILKKLLQETIWVEMKEEVVGETMIEIEEEVVEITEEMEILEVNICICTWHEPNHNFFFNF